ncbi:MAG: hypothetical protein JST00_16990 [Deltaproteobacteria bacterium]|nr:hypothetical protein [Deltaproteobacteria bacterium]
MNAKVLLTYGTLAALALMPLRAQADASEPARPGGADPCAKLEESYKVDRAEATLEQLAQCREKEGKVASAWSWYSDLVSRAVQTGQAEREKAMRDKVAELEKKIPHVTLKLAGHDAVAQIRIDGQPLGRPSWGTPLALDPGPHVFSFAGAGNERAEKRVLLKEGESAIVEPPPLVDPTKSNEPAPAATPLVIDPSLVVREDGSEKRKWGRIALVGGGVGVAIGAVFGVMALSAKSDADALFESRNAGFKAKDEDASTNATVSTVGFGIGLVGAVVGTYLLLTAESDRPTRGWVVPTGTGVAGRF